VWVYAGQFGVCHPKRESAEGHCALTATSLPQEERVLIICGKATLTPDDGSAAVTISAGDFVLFHKGSLPYGRRPLMHTSA